MRRFGSFTAHVGAALALTATAASAQVYPCDGRNAGLRDLLHPGQHTWGDLHSATGIFQANGRPRQLRLSAVRVRPVDAAGRTPEYGDARYDLSVVDLGLAELRDVNGWQEVPLSGVPLDGLFFVTLEIRSAYPGSRFHDTCISGARLVTNPPAASR